LASEGAGSDQQAASADAGQACASERIDHPVAVDLVIVRGFLSLDPGSHARFEALQGLLASAGGHELEHERNLGVHQHHDRAAGPRPPRKAPDHMFGIGGILQRAERKDEIGTPFGQIDLFHRPLDQPETIRP
jgi:hypothetical protein